MVCNVQIVLGDEFYSKAFELGALAHDKLWDHNYAVEIFDVAAVYRDRFCVQRNRSPRLSVYFFLLVVLLCFIEGVIIRLFTVIAIVKHFQFCLSIVVAVPPLLLCRGTSQ